MDLVSVVVATYRRNDDLKRALESLSEQSYANFEIVLVDDNGDSEWNMIVSSIVNEFNKTYPDVVLNHIVNDPNQGSAKARNIGIAAANGKYITFLDDDDIYLPEKIKRQVEFMENGEYDYSITDLILYNDCDRVIDRRIRSYIKDTSTSSLMEYNIKYHMTGTDTMMLKKDYLVKIGGFAPIDVGDEFYLMQRSIEGCGKFGYLPGCDIKAYIHNGDRGLSSGEGKISGENALYEYKKRYFSQLNSSAKRYVKMRHYAVLAFAYYRMKKYTEFVKYGCLSFLVSPMNCLKMIKKSKTG